MTWIDPYPLAENIAALNKQIHDWLVNQKTMIYHSGLEYNPVKPP